MAGTTMVTVEATHTRRGILRSMITRHLDNAIGRGECIAGLWASEPSIYGRFGFGLASENHDIKIDARHLTTPSVAADLQLSLVAPERILDVITPFWSKIATQRAGFIDRDQQRWEVIREDPEADREGATSSRHVIAKRGDNTVGYLEYRQRSKWDGFTSVGAVAISTLVAEDHDAHMALWSYALEIDLFPNIEFWNGAVDDPLSYELRESRAVRKTVTDALYVRVLDVQAALTSRTYEQDGEMVIELADDMGYIAGSYRISIDQGLATVETTTETTTDTAAVQLGARELGALYLGRACVDLYAATGHITGEPAAIRLLGQLFSTARAPWCPEMF